MSEQTRDIKPMPPEEIEKLKAQIEKRWGEKPWYQGGPGIGSPGCMMRAEEILALIAAVEAKDSPNPQVVGDFWTWEETYSSTPGVWHRQYDDEHPTAVENIRGVTLLRPASHVGGWQPMETAPRDGKHCILAIKTGPFVYSIQGAFMQGEWSNAADIRSDPLAWMPNVMVPAEFLPWTEEFKARSVPLVAKVPAPTVPIEIPGELELYEGKLLKVVDASRTGWWRFHEGYDRNGYCDNPGRGY